MPASDIGFGNDKREWVKPRRSRRGGGQSLDRPQAKSLKQRTLSAYGNFVAAVPGWKTCSLWPLPIVSFACKATKVYAKLLPFSMDSFACPFVLFFCLNFNSLRKVCKCCRQQLSNGSDVVRFYAKGGSSKGLPTDHRANLHIKLVKHGKIWPK